MLMLSSGLMMVVLIVVVFVLIFGVMCVCRFCVLVLRLIVLCMVMFVGFVIIEKLLVCVILFEIWLVLVILLNGSFLLIMLWKFSVRKCVRFCRFSMLRSFVVFGLIFRICLCLRLSVICLLSDGKLSVVGLLC